MFLKCLFMLGVTVLVARADAAAEPVGPEYRVGGFVLGCQAYMFHRFTAFEAIEKTAAAGGKAIEFYPGQALSPDEKNIKVEPTATDETIEKLKAKAKQHGLLIVKLGNCGHVTEDGAAYRQYVIGGAYAGDVRTKEAAVRPA